MTIVRRYKISGLNLADSDINRPSEYASDLQNVELDDRRQLVKRRGFDLEDTDDTIALFEYVKGSSLIKFNSSGVDGAINNTSFTYTEEPDCAEYNGVMYFTDPTLVNRMTKYDGVSFYSAGLPSAVPLISPIGGGSGNFFYRAAYIMIDAQKNIIYSDYTQFSQSTNDPAEISIDTLSEYGVKREYAFGAVNTIPPLSTFKRGDPDITFEYTGNKNIEVGSVVMVKGTYGDNLFGFDNTEEVGLAKVTGINGNDITISSELFEEGFFLDQFDTLNLFSLGVRHWFSNDEEYGYARVIRGFGDFGANNYVVEVDQTNPTYTANLQWVDRQAYSTEFWESIQFTFMEDEYDTTIIKGPPPKCKYITIYNNIMVLANTLEEVARNKQKDSSFFWSDTGLGSTVETFPPLNTDDAGISSEGPITGIGSAEDNVIIGKERQVYYVNGSLVLQNYRIRSGMTSGTGCVSFKSMISVDGGVVYMSAKGLYLAEVGSKPIELSAIIEPLFKNQDLDLENSVCVNDAINEKILIYIPHTTSDVVVVYDYKYKEWFLHRGIDASGGIAFVNTDLYHSDSSNIFKRSESYNDNGQAIDAYYRTSWEHQGEPSVTKKWKKFVVISIGDEQFLLNVKHQEDWVDSDITNLNRNIGPITVDDFSLNMSQKKAMRLEFGNNQINQGLLVTGYEYEFEYTQKRPKGES